MTSERKVEIEKWLSNPMKRDEVSNIMGKELLASLTTLETRLAEVTEENSKVIGELEGLIVNLRGQRDRMATDATAILDKLNDSRVQLSAVTQQRDSMREALELYGYHNYACGDSSDDGAACTCGFAQALFPFPPQDAGEAKEAKS